MAAEMTTRERYRRMFEHREADRVPIIDCPWQSTLERWRREGLPENADFAEFLGLDRVARPHFDNSPRYPHEILEETDVHIVETTPWGATFKTWKHAASAPEFRDCLVKDPDSWREAKGLLQNPGVWGSRCRMIEP